MRSEDRQARTAEESDPAAPIGAAPVSPVLGRLYLQQGHLEDAERVFLAVLAANGGDRAALEGLDAVRAKRSESPVGDAADAGSTACPTERPASAHAETIARLESFLNRLRDATAGDLE